MKLAELRHQGLVRRRIARKLFVKFSVPKGFDGEVATSLLTVSIYMFQVVERATWQRFCAILKSKMVVMPHEFTPWMITS